MSQQIHLGIAYKTGRTVTEEEFRKLAYKSVRIKLGFSDKEKECEQIFNADYGKWYEKYNEKISEFIGLSKDDEIDLGPDLKDMPFYKYVNKNDKHIWLGTSGTWLSSDMASLAKVLDIPYCSTVSLSDKKIEQVCKVFQYFLEPEAWNKAAEKMFLSDNPYFTDLQDVAPYNFWTRFDKPKSEKEEEKEDNKTQNDEFEAEDSDDDEEYEYDQDEDFHYWGIKSFMEMVSAYELSKFSQGYGEETESENVKFIASF